MDFKKKYIIRCVQTLLNLEGQPEQLVQNQKLEDFLTSNTIPAILILYKPGKKLKPVFPDQDFPLNPNLLMVVILKMEAEIKPANLCDGYSISISTSDCLNSIVEEINQTYIPILDEKQDNLRQLLKNFSSSISTEGTTYKFDEVEVQSVVQQFLYWKKQEDNSIGPDMKKKAQYFQKCLSQIQPMWTTLDKLQVKQLKQLADITFAALDDIWSDTYPYNARRFANLIKIMTRTLWLRLSIFIPTINSQAKKHIKIVEEVIRNWFKFLDQYISGNWRTKTFPFTESIQSYYDKIQDVKSVLSLFDEISRIRKKISIQIDFDQLKEIFNETVPLSLDAVLIKKWNKAKNIFVSNIESKAPLILAYLKQNPFSVSKSKSKPLKILQQLKNWSGLLSLKFIKDNTSEEKKEIFKFIENYLDSLKHQYESRTGQSLDPIPGKQEILKIKNFSPFLCNIVWTRQIYDKVNRIVSFCSQIFKDIQDLQTMKYESQTFLKDIQSFQNQQLNKWKSQITEASYSDDGLQLQKDAKMMTLDLKNSILYVNYSDRLILLIRQVRQLSELGLRSKIPQQILQSSEIGKKYYKQALILKKIASFYNNMGQEIIDCQKGMLLQELKNFQHSVKSVNDQCQQKDEITWDKPSNVDRYIQVLNKATTRLVQENSRLYKLHMNIMDIIAGLANEDLRKGRSIWLNKLNEIKQLIENGCQNKQAKYCRKWKVHCDVQLYKILEMQFLNGLNDDESVLNDLNLEVIIKNKNITLKPSFQDLKQKYYKDIMDYIMWPARQFKGIVGNLDIYQKIGEKNNFVIKSLISKAQSTFSMLTIQIKNLDQWSVIPYLSSKGLGKLIKTMQQWEFNIRVIRMKRKQLQKIPDNNKIQCFNINMVKFKNQADQYLSQFIQSMMISLKESVIQDTKQINDYLRQSLSKLNKKPSSVQQMQTMKNSYLNIKGKQKQVKRKFQQILIKKKWILQATGYHHETSQIQQDWGEFNIKIQDYDTLLAQQIQHLKSLVGTRVKQLQNDIIKFQSKTNNLNLPANRSQINVFIQFLQQQKQDQQQLLNKIQMLKNDCQQFQLSKPIIQVKNIDWTMWETLQQYFKQLMEFNQVRFVKMKTEKMFEFQDFCLKWQEIIKPLEKTKQIIFILKELEVFKSLFNLIKLLSSGILQKEHWRQLYIVVKGNYKHPEEILFNDILDMSKQLNESLGQIQQLISKAQGEATLKQALQELAIWWETAEFQLTVYEGKRNKTSLIKEWKEISLKVSDNMSLVSSLKQSRWIGKYAEQVENFQKKIGKVQRAIYSLNNIQRKWVYLQPILVGGALPEQMERFDKLDASFRVILNLVAENPKIYTLSNIEGLQENLDTILEEQQKCQKALNDYLQLKRTKFPRFYFLGDQDLLQILAQTKNPAVIQLHMKKLFAAIHSVQFAEQNKKIVSILSLEKQKVSLNQSIVLVDNVEVWLDKLQKSMFSTLQQSLAKYVASGTKQIKLTDYCSQILCVMQQIRFTSELQEAVSSKTIKQLSVKLKQDLQNLTKILPTVSKLQGIKLKALILDLIHHLNVVEYLIKDQKPVTLNSYSLIRNFRFNAKPQLQIFNSSFKYTFEYQGNLPKLVHTPLTDKCYITLSLALSLGMGGNPYGPAGTGKTQTVKAMAMLFGRMCLVFNCDQALDYKSMGRIFLGLVKCGAWGCFDQFNRLLEEQLSAISQQIQIIQFAIKSNQSHIELVGKRVQVNTNSGIFVTLNPAGKGYGGRSKLPDNLKQLFRPVAMSVPDNELIAQVYLYAEGFKQAKQLAQKIICLFTLSKQLLSPQQHYDWGLRALKTILSVAGRLIFTQRAKNQSDIGFEKQCQLLIKAIRVNVLSKLTFTDMRKFKFLLQDIFPGIESKDIIYEQMQKAVKQSLIEMNLQVNQNQISKILQFYEATQQRMGVVLVGPSGCGKTTIWKVLKRSFEKMSLALKTYLINPKSMARQQLLGYMDNDTRQFTEGVLTATSREVVKNSCYNWIILDGDIDPEWIQSLNSVLDDNHILTLPTGERISFASTTCFIFETDSLVYASPATVSRMGMIYLNDEDINIDGIVNKWCDANTEIKQYFDNFNLRNFIGFAETVTSTLVGQVNQVLSQMKGVKHQSQFIAAVSNGLSANYLEEKGQLISKVFEAFNEKNPFSAKQSLYFYSQSKSYRLYSTLPQEFDFDQVMSQNGAILKTAMSQSYLDRLKKWVNNNQNFLIVGPQGCGKSMLIKHAYTQIKKNHKINFATMYCNSQTNAQHVIQKLYQVCLKMNSGSGKLLRPKQCYRQVLYLKDINLPKPDKYQTIQLVSFLQQIISHKGFYDSQTLQFVAIDEKIQIVASMLPPNSIGRNALTQRFTAIVRILNIDYPSNQQLVSIYTQYFRALLKIKQMQLGFSQTLAQFFIDSYNQISSNFSVDTHRHYNFTPKHLFKMYKSLIRYEFSDKQSLVEALVNELFSHFRNKLVSLEVKNKFEQIILGLVKSHFKINLKGRQFFNVIGGKYQKIPKQDYFGVVKSALVQYERTYKHITFIYHDECMNQISSIQKALHEEDSIALFGTSGMGRQTTLQIASLITKMDMVRLPNLRNFGPRQFRKQLKLIIQNTLNENKQVVLLLQDHNFNHPSFIQMTNSLMTSGEIPGLFALEEIERLAIIDQLRQESVGKSLYDTFCKRIKKQIKIVLSLDISSEGFHEKCASNPAIFASNIIWYDQLAKNTVKLITTQILSKQLPQFSQQQIDEISNMTATVYKKIELDYKAPQRDLFQFLATFSSVFQKKSKSKNQKALHLQKGLQKLVQAKQLVDVLSKQAMKKQQQLAVKQQQANKALKQIQKAMGEAAIRRGETEELSNQLQVEQQKIHSKKQSVQQQLAGVKPILQQAKKSVSGISSSNLNQLASLPKPPQAVKIVMKSVVRIFGEPDAQWNTIKGFLKNRGFIDNIINFDPRVMGAKLRSEVQNQVAKNAMYFEKSAIYRASLAAGPLADWTKAIIKYSKVIQSIKPLETQLNKVMAAISTSKKRVMECQQQLAKIDEKVKDLKKIFSSKTSQAQALKNELAKAEDTLKRAQNLLSKLQDQNVRWNQQHKNIEKQITQYPTLSFLASACIIYLSDKDQAQRYAIQKQWIQVVSLQKFQFLKFMIDEGTQLKWRSLGLSSDQLSVQNSVMVNQTSKVPLIMDPNNSAINWIKQWIDKLQITNQNHQKFTNQLQLAVRFGKNLLIEQLDQIEPILIPILKKDIEQDGSRSVIRVGDKVIEFNPDFHIYLSTRNTNMKLPSHAKSLVSLINYSVTQSGLESKLLSLVINHEKPEIQHKKTQLLHKEEQLKMSLVKLQQQLLQELGSSSGNILQNKTLLDNLTQTKVQSSSIQKSLKQSEELNSNLDAQRDNYRPLAKKGATIYLILTQLWKINNMYRFSLKYFTKLFLSCLTSNSKLSIDKNNLTSKLQAAFNEVNKIVFNNISSALFKKDRLAFGIYLVKGIYPQQISNQQWQFFTGLIPPPLQNKVVLPSWSSFDRQQIFNSFCFNFPKLAKQINFNDKQFQSWNLSEEPEKKLPTVCQKLTNFQKILIVMVFKPERLQNALNSYVTQKLAISSVGGATQTFNNIVAKQIDKQTPVLFIVSTGYDPSKQLEEFCEAQVGRENYLQLSMGGGQNNYAIELIKQAAQTGKWVCLKNLHLVTAWLSNLQKQLKLLQTKHDNFKVFLTSQEHMSFPNILLETCFKVSYQSPPGLKKNFLRTYQQIQSAGSNLKNKLVFLLAYFHALVQQRKNYIPQGWSKSYEFSYSDLKVSLEIIDQIVKEHQKTKNLNLQLLYGAFEDGIYGGRIDNFSDQKILKAYLRKYFNLLVINCEQNIGFDCVIPKTQKELSSFVNKIPEVDNPKIFGLPNSIDKAVQKKNCSEAILSLKQLLRFGGSQQQIHKDQWQKIFNPLIQTWRQAYKQIKAGKFPVIKSSHLLSQNPIQSFIYLQGSQALSLLQEINQQFAQLELVIQGKSLITNKIQSLMKKLAARQVPTDWLVFWQQSEDPYQWIRVFGKKIMSLKDWVYKAQNSRLLGQVYDLAQLFHPVVFLNACKQYTSRNKIALDKLDLVATFEEDRASQNAIKLKNLLVQGCSLANFLLAQPSAKSGEFQELPLLYVDFLANPPPLYPSQEEFCLYSSVSRQNVLLKMKLGISGDKNQKIIAGTALFLRQI